MEAVAVDGEGVTCEVRLQMESQADLVTLPCMALERKGRETKGEEETR